ncbi:MAG: NADH/ubiquinone/plastoquinone (complex I) [Elusimicrobia bacterium]|nr:NADH/ubiquinone/plastoquinone (complex I) [Elusimicrobiota bacterium]
MIPYFVIIPLAGAFIIVLLNHLIKSDARYAVTDSAANLATAALMVLSFLSISKTGSYTVGGWEPPFGINLVADGLSVLMLCVVNTVSFAATLFSVDYMKRYTAKRYYYSLFLLMVAGMNGVILSGDFFNLFVFLEIASISSYALVGFGTEAEEIEASFKYIVMGGIASAFILLGIAFLYSRFGVLNMAFISQAARANPSIAKFPLILFTFGFLIKAAAVPFHSWLPDAHPSAPAPISAMLSGVLIKTLGIYTIIRIAFGVFNWETGAVILRYVGIATIIVASLTMNAQKDLKRLMAYSSISNIGLILLAFGLNTKLGFLAGIFHLLNHSIMKSLLFLTSGAVFYRTGTRQMFQLGGLAKKMPATAATSLIGSFSISGIPPFGGFFSKLLIILAAVAAKNPAAALWAIFGSVLTLAAFARVQKTVFFGEEKKEYENLKEVPASMTSAMLILAVLCLAASLLYLPKFRKEFLSPAADALNPQNYRELVLK